MFVSLFKICIIYCCCQCVILTVMLKCLIVILKQAIWPESSQSIRFDSYLFLYIPSLIQLDILDNSAFFFMIKKIYTIKIIIIFYITE